MFNRSKCSLLYRPRCIPELSVAWSRELSTAPFAATPLITHVDVDNELDIVATSFSGDVHVVNGKDGQYKQGTSWPYRLPHSSILASPVQVWIVQAGNPLALSSSTHSVHASPIQI